MTTLTEISFILALFPSAFLIKEFFEKRRWYLILLCMSASFIGLGLNLYQQVSISMIMIYFSLFLMGIMLGIILVEKFSKKVKVITLILCALLGFATMLIPDLISHTYSGDLEDFIESGNGTIDDPYILSRSNEYTSKFDQIVIEQLNQTDQITETYPDQNNGGYFIGAVDPDLQINYLSIHYLTNDNLVDIIIDYNTDQYTNPISYTNYFGNTITNKDLLMIEDLYENYKGGMLINYIINYEDQYYLTTTMIEWQGYKLDVDESKGFTIGSTTIPYTKLVSSDVYIYNFYNGTYLSEKVIYQ